MPSGFSRYARILHPAALDAGRETQRYATWADIAAWSGQSLHADSSSEDLMVRGDGSRWDEQPGRQRPSEGTEALGEVRQERLGRLLAAATGTPERLWLLIDEVEYPDRPVRLHASYGPTSARRFAIRGRFGRREERRQLERRRARRQQFGVEVAGESFILHTGVLGRWRDPKSPAPSYWWPDDRAWLVYTNIDCTSTYVAGSAELINALLADELLEVVAAHLHDPYDGHG